MCCITHSNCTIADCNLCITRVGLCVISILHYYNNNITKYEAYAMVTMKAMVAMENEIVNICCAVTAHKVEC